MSECVRCGGEAVPGQLGDRCRDCLREILKDTAWYGDGGGETEAGP